MDTTDNNFDNIAPLLIQDEMRDSYLDYAMSVIVGRALPDVRDGLKPVHRRSLFAMHMQNNYHNKPYLKSARIVGDVIGKYHPHGDSAVYNTIVRLAQDFSMRYCLVDGQGNFGSIDGDNAAAMRYTEIRMDKLSGEFLKDIDKDTVAWRDNYDGSLKEPSVLPTKVPNLLINGSSGIAVGMSTNIPPHNLTEIVSGLIELIENPELTSKDLMEIIPGPDFPTGGTIQGTMGIKSAYLNGRGIIQVRAQTDIEIYGKQDRERIVVTELPYQVNKARLVGKIAKMVNDKVLTGISDIRDESSREGIRVVIELKRGQVAQVVLNQLYKNTQLQVSFGIIFLAIDKGQPKVFELKGMLEKFIDHRREIVIRRTHYDLKKAREKAHLLEGMKIAVENIDEVVAIIKGSNSPKEAKGKLENRFELSPIQSQAILDMRLQKLTGLERDKIIQEYKEVLALIAELEKILSSMDLINEIIKEEFVEIKEKYGDERKTLIQVNAGEIETEDLITNEEVIVTFTHKGYIKRMGNDTYTAQRRGGKGVKGSVVEEDFVTKLFMTNTHQNLYFFSSAGKVFKLKAYQVPEAQRTGKGRNIANLIALDPNEKIQELVNVPKEQEGLSLIMVTKRGLVKRIKLSEFKNIRQTGIKAINILEGDELISVEVADETKDVLIISSGGKSIRFPVSSLRSQGRTAQGNKGISLGDDEHVVKMDVISDGDMILAVTEKGYGKRTKAEEYRSQSRGGKGIKAMKISEKNGPIVSALPVDKEDDIIIVSDQGQAIRIPVEDVSILGRDTQGVRLFKAREGEKVVGVEKIKD